MLPAVAAALLTLVPIPACASGIDDKVFDQQSLDALQAKVRLAQPRDLCFLYAQLVHEMTELSVRQYAAGDISNATNLLKQIQPLALKIHSSMVGGDKRLKDAEILLRHTSFRLTEMLHSSSFEDRPLVEQTLAQVSQAQNQAMLQVFSK
jgi:hypothetical protein